ncbi:MAG: hypothetical protein NZ928_02320 [Endomicrobia bacterium]|nr:hypothetical protein [Endomicrobiia bacterium]MDW8055781.1 hypothetical protein [Elusimicrobiota bacterium]
MRKIFLLLLVVIVITNKQNLYCVFEEIGVSVEGKVLGDGFLVLCDNPSALYYNPSMLSTMKKRELSLFYQDIYNLGLLTNMFVGYVNPRLGRGGVGIGWVRMGTTNNVDFMEYSENTFIFAYGQKLGKNLLVGSNIKCYYVDYDYKATGFGMDISFTYQPFETARAGIVVKNLLLTDIVWQTGTKENIPYICQLGVSNTFNKFTVLAGFYFTEKNFEPSVGIKYDLSDSVSLMVGTRVGYKENLLYTLGTVFSFRKFRFAFGIDYHKILGINTFLELGYKM